MIPPWRVPVKWANLKIQKYGMTARATYDEAGFEIRQESDSRFYFYLFCEEERDLDNYLEAFMDIDQLKLLRDYIDKAIRKAEGVTE